MDCKLDTLVGVENIGLTMQQRLTQGSQTKDTIQRIGNLPGNDEAAEPVHDRHQVHEALGHRHIRNIRRPDLIRSIDYQTSQQIGIFLVLRMENGSPWSRVDACRPIFAIKRATRLQLTL
jgi:hypothetical protein